MPYGNGTDGGAVATRRDRQPCDCVGTRSITRAARYLSPVEQSRFPVAPLRCLRRVQHAAYWKRPEGSLEDTGATCSPGNAALHSWRSSSPRISSISVSPWGQRCVRTRPICRSGVGWTGWVQSDYSLPAAAENKKGGSLSSAPPFRGSCFAVSVRPLSPWC